MVGNESSLRDCIGIDVGRHLKLEDGIEWAARHARNKAFGSLDDILAASDYLVEKAKTAGVAV